MSKFIPCADDDPRRFLENQRFGKLVITRCLTDRDKTKGYSNLIWEAKCDCGNIHTVTGYNLLVNHTQSCGCHQKECLKNLRLDIIGKRFGKLVVTKFIGIHEKYKQTVWECKCDCGNTIQVLGSYLNLGKKTSCGCYKKEYKLKKDLTGVKFGDWTVVSRAENKTTPNGQPRIRWNCVNSKGETKTVFATAIMQKLRCPTKKKDLSGQTFGKLKVLFEVDWEKTPTIEIQNPGKKPKIYTRKQPCRYWWCECACGNRIILSTHSLKNTDSCGCDKVQGDYTGRKFGKLTVLSYAGKNKKGEKLWNCQCVCGKQKTITSDSLRSGTQSCGCDKRKKKK